jgi:hypothetical protein
MARAAIKEHRFTTTFFATVGFLAYRRLPSGD